MIIGRRVARIARKQKRPERSSGLSGGRWNYFRDAFLFAADFFAAFLAGFFAFFAAFFAIGLLIALAIRWSPLKTDSVMSVARNASKDAIVA